MLDGERTSLLPAGAIEAVPKRVCLPMLLNGRRWERRPPWRANDDSPALPETDYFGKNTFLLRKNPDTRILE